LVDIEKIKTLRKHSGRLKSIKERSLVVENSESDADVDMTEIPSEMRVSKKLSNLTTQRVILLILMMLFLLPFFEINIWIDDLSSFQYGLHALVDLNESPIVDEETFQLAYWEYVDYHKDLNIPLIYLKVQDHDDWEGGISAEDLRLCEYESAATSDEKYVAIYDIRAYSRLNSYISLGKKFKNQIIKKVIRENSICLYCIAYCCYFIQ
jgi:hypothetical protein